MPSTRRTAAAAAILLACLTLALLLGAAAWTGHLQRRQVARVPGQPPAAQPVPDDRNAAPLYRQSAYVLDSWDLACNEERAFIPYHRLSGAHRQAIANDLDTNQIPQQVLRQAAARPHLQVDLALEPPPFSGRQQYRLARLAADALAMCAGLEASRRQADLAWQDLANSLRVCRQLDQPSLLAQHHRLEALMRTASELQGVLAACPPTSARTRAVLDLLVGDSLARDLATGLRAHRREVLGAPAATVQVISQGSPGLPWGAPRSQDLRAFNRLLGVAIQASSSPPALGQALAARIDREVEDAPGSFVVTRGAIRPVVTEALRDLPRARGMLSLARWGVALEAWRRRTGGYPGTLAQARGALPGLVLTDPWGRPWAYGRKGKGYLLYSLGADGRDSGGTDHGGPDPYTGTRPDDLCWYGREGQLATAR